MKYSGINGLDSFFKKSLLGFLHIPSCDTSRTQTFFWGGSHGSVRNRVSRVGVGGE